MPAGDRALRRPPARSKHGLSVLQLRQDPDDLARWDRLKSVLRDARARRAYPARDDKVVAAWNGLAITALARAGVVLEKPAYVEAAVAAAGLVREVHLDDDGKLRRTSRDGKVAPRTAYWRTTPRSPGVSHPARCDR